MIDKQTTQDTLLQIALASGANFRSYPVKGEQAFLFQDLVKAGYFSKSYRAIENNSAADIDYRNRSSLPITVDGKTVEPGAFIDW